MDEEIQQDQPQPEEAAPPPIEEPPAQPAVAEEAPAQAEQPVEEAAPSDLEPLAALFAHVVDLAERVSHLEQIAHTEHTISADGVQQIATAAVQQINDQLRQRFGLGGQPARG